MEVTGKIYLMKIMMVGVGSLLKIKMKKGSGGRLKI